MNTNRLLHLIKDLARIENDLNSVVDEICGIVSVDIKNEINETLITDGTFEAGKDNV